MEMSFSSRRGLEPPREAFQLDSMDWDLRVALYNYLLDEILKKWTGHFRNGSAYADVGQRAARIIFTDFFRRPADEFNTRSGFFQPILKTFVLEGPWNKVYDLLEFIESDTPLELDTDTLNRVLERDMSAYRWREGQVVAVSDETELAAIDAALAVPEPFVGARAHIVDALAKLSLKPDPDLRNAITEAVSAVESAARVVTGKPKAGLSDALKVLEKDGRLHPALKDAWVKLYGYTSDEEGLRHAMTDEPDIDFATAKYMVVSCAAFVNLLSTLPPKV